MADILKVTTEELRSTVQQYKSCQSQLQTAYLQMSNAVRVLDSSWNGDASEAFKTQFDAMYKNLEQTEQKVEDASTELTQAAEQYDENESTLQSEFGGLDVGTDPFSV